MPAFAKTVLLAWIIPTIAFCIPNILFGLFWIIWARQKLEHQFRIAGAGLSGALAADARGLSAPPPPVATPPVISQSS
jgi:hypothetical protein